MGYTIKEHIQILIALLKEHNIRKIIISPGATNVVFVGSVQSDDWFEIYSAPDERSAAYMACGLSEASGEAVALSCTGATASRNYMPGLTEAYYRKLPVLAITSGITPAMPYNNTPQVLDRSILPNDIANESVVVSDIYSNDDYWKCVLNINKAILALSANGGGPAHIQLLAEFASDFSTKTLPLVNVIQRYTGDDMLPDIDFDGRIAIRVGAHKYWDKHLTTLVDAFCERYNAIVLCDHSSGYHGKYRIMEALIGGQEGLDTAKAAFDLLIDIGDITANYFAIPVKKVWRVSPDGKISDRYRKLSKVFVMSEQKFFKAYTDEVAAKRHNLLFDELSKLYNELLRGIPSMPFSNVWIAQQLHDKMPGNSYLHLGILNSIRAWNFFEIDPSIHSTANTGGFGIDGALSTTLGASLADKEKVCFCILGDLAFFYDMNALGNRHIGKNIRILLINNGIGTEFKNYWHPGAIFGTHTNDFIAAGGHYGNKSRNLVRHYAEDLGFEYISAENKKEFAAVYGKFIDSATGDKPIIFEVFTTPNEESEALKLIRNILKGDFKHRAKAVIKRNISPATIKRVKNILGR